MAAGFKTIFRMIRGRLVPIRESLSHAPSELQKVVHIQRAREAIKATVTSGDFMDRKMLGVFYRLSKKQAKVAGQKISKRVSRLGRYGK